MQHHNAIATDAGKASIAMLVSFCAVLVLAVLFGVGDRGAVSNVQATTTATTTVTVLNQPPQWTETAREYYPSSTSTPTNSGTSTVWTAIGTDSNSENYYLLICKSSSTPTAQSLAAPACGGGTTDLWGVSTSTISGQRAFVSTTTTNDWAEKNDWYAYICDYNEGSPRCNAAMYNGLHEPGEASATSSPFMVNRRPILTSATDDSPTLPGATTTWNAVADDPDSVGGDDTIKLHVCKAQDFNVTLGVCGGGGFWASSTFVTSNPSAEGYITIPMQDTNYGAYVYLIDEHGHVSDSLWHGSSTVLTVANAAPYVSSSSIQLYNTFGTTTTNQNLTLTVPEGVTNNFVLQFEVNDDNSCEAFGGGNEITATQINVFRSAVGGALGAGCDASGEFNANNCYTHTTNATNWAPTCYQVPGSCAGPADSTAVWECTFPLWYVADATDVGSEYAGEDWRGSARAIDEALTGPYSTYDGGIDVAGSANVQQFLSFRATGSPIAYGAWEPGENTGTLSASTTLYVTGNTGVDEALSGDPMCINYPTCSNLATSTIFVGYQRYASTSVAYGSGIELSTSTLATRFNLRIPKTTATSSPTNAKTYWGIAVPSSITVAGDYIGRNYIDALVSPSAEW